VVLGPTCTGKSALGIEIAKKFNGEIINCDSMQVYKGFDIGTDKVPPALRKEVRHHLLDILDHTQQFTAADFARLANKTISDILSREKLPIIVGGTGLYIRALLNGIFPGPGRNEELRAKLKKEVKEKGISYLRKELERIDPVYARIIGKNDEMRIIRALEVFYLTGKPISEHFKNTHSELHDFHKIKIGLILDRKELYKRINERVERMYTSGMVSEVKKLLEQGINPESPPFRALGYKYALLVAQGEMSEKEAILLTQRDTRRYAKRQIIWFKKEKDIHWFSPYEKEKIFDFLRKELNKN
ncbi:tRNA (adenosine(37)-N6)-dimethylallyltransferase MiaA, partial [Candidatus Aminicenantes bacterium AC-335-O07]|nr:tRNA (adenosine(37)-N6)-dimethylallyltransferase MiaA [Candidatus Aminicenantes bacterium AC-335-O07]